MTPEQVINARGLLGWTRKRLDMESHVGIGAISAYETTGKMAKGRGRYFGIDRKAAIRAALEAAGVELIKGNGSGPGVRLKATL